MSTTQLERGTEFLRGSHKFEPAVIDAFAKFLMEAPDEELYRMNPLRYAEQHGLDEKIAIDLFLYATHAGLLEFTWGILCPTCRGFLSTAGAVRSLKGERHCSLCDCKVTAGDDTIEVAFTIAPATRVIRLHDPSKHEYKRDFVRINFSPSIEVPPHVAELLAKNVIHSGSVPAGETVKFEVELKEGLYRIPIPSEHAWLHIKVEPSATSTRVDADLGDGQLVPWKTSVKPGPVTITLKNRTGRSAMFGVARAIEGLRLREIAPLRTFLSGKRLVTTQAFRDLFRTESVPSEGGLQFKSLTVVFTDLKGSTELYQRIGDMRAYGLVREHFDLLKNIIQRSGGSMVKTIGDAIMASFAEVAPAMEAAAAMNEEIARIGQGELQLKIGLHTGPAIAVELNEQLDYFGQTVNVAARVQNLAEGGEIVCTDAVWESPGVRDRIQRARLQDTTDRALLKGVAGEFVVHRLRA